MRMKYLSMSDDALIARIVDALGQWCYGIPNVRMAESLLQEWESRRRRREKGKENAK